MESRFVYDVRHKPIPWQLRFTHLANKAESGEGNTPEESTEWLFMLMELPCMAAAREIATSDMDEFFRLFNALMEEALRPGWQPADGEPEPEPDDDEDDGLDVFREALDDILDD